MARRYGTAGSISSLISSARSAYERQQSVQDQIAALEWDQSPKTSEDHDRYVSYLNKRRQQVEAYDPSKAISITSKINSARSTLASATIKRANIEINYGNMTDTDKYKQMFGLYQNAINNGDLDLAQNLELQLGNLERKIKDAAQASANAAAAASSKAYNQYKSNLAKEIKYADDGIKALIRQKERGEITDKEFYQGIKTKQPDGSYKAIGGYGELVALKDSLLGKAASDPTLNEEDRYKYDQQRAEFQQNGDFKQATDAGLNVAKYAQGIDPQYAEYDKNNNLQYRDKNVIAGLPGLGNLYEIPNLADAGNLDSNAKNRKAILFKSSASGDKQGVALQAYLSTDNPLLKDFGKFYYAKDPTTGKLYFVNEQGYATGEVNLDKPEEIAKNSKSLLPKQNNSSLGGLIDNLNRKKIAIDQAAKVAGYRSTIEKLGYKDLIDQFNQNAAPLSGFGLNRFGLSNQEKKLAELVTLAQQRKAIDDAKRVAAAGANMPKFDPNQPVSITPQNTVVNTIGPRLPTPALKKAASTIGSPTFVDKYNLGKAYKRYI